MGREVYDLITGQHMSMIAGIAREFNNSFPEVQNLLNMASEVCSTINGKNVENYSKNKDLLDLLLYRMANQGMYGAINQLMNCADSQKYITNDTYKVLANRLMSRCSAGDVKTTSTIQQLVGNSKISNAKNAMYTLALNTKDTSAQNVSDYMTLLSNINVSPSSLTGKNYTSKNGSTTYVYSTSNINKLSNNNVNIVDALLGNSNTRKIAKALSARA